MNKTKSQVVELPKYKIPHDLQKYFRPKLDNCYVCHLVLIFREVKRVLRKDGTLWLNLGSSYVDKQEQMIPARVALALQSDGWWLRSEIVWSKPNPMPESVTDRPTRAHEYIFLLTRDSRYFYDQEAIKVPAAESTLDRGPVDFGGEKGRNYNPEPSDPNYRGGNEQWGRTYHYGGGKVNRRSVWTITTQPFPLAHFATFPEEIPRTCILAGCPENGTVLDPFMGSGRTLIIAKKLRRRAIGIELNPEYCEMLIDHLAQEVFQFNRGEI